MEIRLFCIYRENLFERGSDKMSSSESDPEIEENSESEDQSEAALTGAEAWESLGVCSELAKTCEDRLIIIFNNNIELSAVIGL